MAPLSRSLIRSVPAFSAMGAPELDDVLSRATSLTRSGHVHGLPTVLQRGSKPQRSGLRVHLDFQKA